MVNKMNTESETTVSVLYTIKNQYGSLSEKERLIADFIIEHKGLLLTRVSPNWQRKSVSARRHWYGLLKSSVIKAIRNSVLRLPAKALPIMRIFLK